MEYNYGRINYENINYEYLFSKYKNYVYQSAYSILKNGEDAEDIVQETFIVSYKRRYTLRDTTKFKFWIRRIAVNLAIDKYRKKQREILVGDGGENYYSNDIPINPDPTEKIVEEKERNRYLKKKIYGLKEEYREIIELYYYSELSYKEIGELLDINLGAVKSRLYRAKDQLRKHIM